ncbi:hypothetical protein BDZ91DRAFT_218059 [Kalaharituber pfeilii]|nr:hypothetical protein BDZ91DRAFT_218059 [Kalaharituber pfeilii]
MAELSGEFHSERCCPFLRKEAMVVHRRCGCMRDSRPDNANRGCTSYNSSIAGYKGGTNDSSFPFLTFVNILIFTPYSHFVSFFNELDLFPKNKKNYSPERCFIENKLSTKVELTRIFTFGNDSFKDSGSGANGEKEK